VTPMSGLRIVLWFAWFLITHWFKRFNPNISNAFFKRGF
jgi:hypothetical protein